MQPPLPPLKTFLPWVMPLLLLPLTQGGTIPGLAPFLPLRHILGHPGGPRRLRGLGPPNKESSLVPDIQSPSHHLLKALLEISLRICPLHRSSGDPTSTAALFKGVLIAVRGICTVRFIMISRPSLKIQSSEIRCD